MADKYINETGVATIRDWANGKFALDSDLDALAAEVDEIISEGGEPNTIESISVNGTPVTPDINKNVALAVPTKTSDITNDGDGQSNFATEAYVDQNGGKIDKIKRNGVELQIDSSDKSVNILVTDTAATTSAAGLMSAADKTKLDGVAAGAEANVQANWNESDTSSDAFIQNKPTIPTAVSDLTNDSGYQTASDVESAIASAVSSAYKYKGSVATVGDLPASGNTTGDVYDVQANGMNYAWNGTAWDALGQIVDTSVLWTSTAGQSNSLIAMTVAEINTILTA